MVLMLRQKAPTTHGRASLRGRSRLRFVDAREHGGFREEAQALLPGHDAPLEHSIGYRHMVRCGAAYICWPQTCASYPD